MRIFISLLLLLWAAPVWAAGPVELLRPGRWYLGSTNFVNSVGVVPSPLPQSNTGQSGSTGHPAVMSAFSGGMIDPVRNLLIVHGGGHGDYPGNEVYAYSFASGTWSRMWGPTANASIPPSNRSPITEDYLNGDPASVHTYDGMVYLPTQDVYMRVGGSLWSGGGDGSRATWWFDPDTLTWTRKADAKDFTNQGNIGGVSIVCAYDSVGDHAYCASDQGRMGRFTPSTNRWDTRLGISGLVWREQMSGDIDPERRLFVITGGQNGSSTGTTIVYNIASNTAVTQTTTGDQTCQNAKGPNIIHDPRLKQFICYAGGTSLYILNPDTWVWSSIPASPLNTVTPSTYTAAGTHGRFNYLPSKNLYMVVNSTSTAVYYYKLTAGDPSEWLSLTNQTWTPISNANVTSLNGPNAGNISKHSRMTFDSTRGKLMLAGGDHNYASRAAADGWSGFNQTLDGQVVWSLDLQVAPLAWDLVSGFCNGPLLPGQPDTVGWAYDSKRDRVVMTPGYYEGAQLAHCANGATGVYDGVFFNMVTNLWDAWNISRPSGTCPACWGGDGGSSYAVYDEVSDTLYRCRSTFLMERFNFTSGGFSSTSLKPGASPTRDCNRDQLAIDEEGRHIYWLDRYAGQNVAPYATPKLIKYSIVSNSIVGEFTVPDGYSTDLGSDRETYTVFDPINRVVILVGKINVFQGDLHQVDVFKVDAGTWETFAPPDPNTVRGNVLGFDWRKNALLFLGRSATNQAWLWRYSDAGALAEPPTPGSGGNVLQGRINFSGRGKIR